MFHGIVIYNAGKKAGLKQSRFFKRMNIIRASEEIY